MGQHAKLHLFQAFHRQLQQQPVLEYAAAEGHGRKSGLFPGRLYRSGNLSRQTAMEFHGQPINGFSRQTTGQYILHQPIRGQGQEALRVHLRRFQWDSIGGWMRLVPGFCPVLQGRGRFSLKGGCRPDAQYGTHAVKQPSRAGGTNRVDVSVRHDQLHLCGVFLAQRQLADDIQGRGAVFGQSIDHAHRNSPALPGRGVPAQLQERLNTAQAPEAVLPGQKQFAAPDGTVRSIAGAVKGYADHRVMIIVFRHAGEDVGVVMLHLNQRQLHAFRHCHGVISRVQITHHRLRLRLQQRLESPNGFLQCLHRPEILQIPHVGRKIAQVIYADAKAVFQLTAHSQYGTFVFAGQYHRQRRISPAPAHHIGLPPKEIHHRIVRPNADIPVMGQNAVRQMAQFRFRIPVIPADGRAADVAAGHHQAVRHGQAIVIVK